MLDKWSSDFKENDKMSSEELFLFKMIIDSKGLLKINKEIKKQKKELYDKNSRNELEKGQFKKELLKIQELDFIKI